MIMKTILSTLVALSVLAGAAATSAQAATFGSTSYWIERDTNAN
jgi:Ni/Co efflux regulator RcnB